MKIKTLSILIIVVVISLILLVQLLSYVNFLQWGNRQIDMIFESTVMDISGKISDEIDMVENVAFNISIDESVQRMIYRSASSNIVKHVREVWSKMEIYTFNAENIRYTAIAKGDDILCSSTINNVSSRGMLMLCEQILKDDRGKMENNRFIGNYRYDGKIFFAYLSKIFPIDTSLVAEADGYVIVLFELGNNIFNENSSEEAGKQRVVTLLDKEKKVLESSSDTVAVGEEYVTRKGGNFVSKTVFLDEISCGLNVSMPAYAILDIGQPTGVLLILIVIFVIVIFAFLMLTLINMILKSILEIERGTQRISGGDYSYRLTMKGQNEISNIVGAINGVLDAVEEYNQERINTTNKLYEAKLLQKQAEISHMQNQISPHFLYNSMEQINSLARENNMRELIAITNIMAATFRYNSDGAEITTVAEDIDYAFNYFNVINLRRANPIAVNYNIPDDILYLKSLKMIFQPILENIIKHAFSPGEEGTVTITGNACGDYAVIRIEDNGHGIPREKLEKIRKKLEDTESLDNISGRNSIGVLNVHKRLRIYYDDPACGISIDSTYGIGTVVSVKIRKNS